MSASIDLGTISAGVSLDLSKLSSGRAAVSAELAAIGGALDRLAAKAEEDGRRVAAAAFSREQQAALKKQQSALDAAAARSEAMRARTVAGFMGVAGGITLAGVAAVKMAADFDASMTKVANNTTMTTADIAKMKAAVVGMGKESGASFDDLAEGFAHVTNFGFKAAESTTILREAMKSAVATGSKVSDTADILAKSLHEFSLGAGDAGRAMNVMHLAAAQGNMTLQQFDQAAGPAFAQAANLGVGLTDVSAAMAALTRHGLDASEAATQVKDILVHLINPSKSAREELEKLSAKTGIDLVADFSQAGLKAKGLTGVLDDLARATNGNGQEIYKLIQAQRGGLGAMILAGTGAKDYKDILGSLSDAMSGKVDPTTAAYQKTLKTLNSEVARLTNEVRADFLPVGEKLTPLFEAAIPVVRETAQVLGHVLDVFNALPQPVQEAILAVGTFKLGSLALNTALGTLGGSLPGLITGFGRLGGAAAAAGTAETAAAAEGATAFAAGGAWALGIGAAIALVWSLKGAWDHVTGAQEKAARDKAWQEINAGKAADQAHGADGNVDRQIVKNRSEASRIRGSKEYKFAGQEIAAYEQQIREIRAGGTAPFRGHGESTQTALGEYFSALKTAQTNLAGFVQQKRKMDKDAKALEADAARMAPDSQSTGVGMKIANAAWKKQIGLDRAAYNDGCQRLARQTVQAVTPAFNRFFAGSALETLRNFQHAGLAQRYTPGQSLPAGSLLYSETMGRRGKKIDGHVQVVGPGGHRLDQHGQDQFALKNFQYYVPPPGVAVNEAAARAAATPGGGGYHAPADPNLAKDRAALSQDLKDQLYEATHQGFANRRYEAKRDRDRVDADPAATPASRAEAQRLYLAKIREINADERKEQKTHYAELLRQWKEHLRQKAQAEGQARAASQAILQGARRRRENLTGLSLNMADNTAALTQDPDEYGFAKQKKDAEERLRARQKAIRENATLGPYGKTDIDPGTLLGQAQAEHDAAIKHIDGLRQAKAAKDREDKDGEAKDAKEKADRVIAEAARAAEKQQADIEETARFEYEHGLISLSQYQAFLKARLASLEQWADASHTVLSKDWMKAKGDYDAALGDKKRTPGKDPFGSVGDGMKSGFGEELEKALDGGKGRLHGLKAEVKDWEDAAIKSIKHVAAAWAMSSLFGSKFGGGFNFGGGGHAKAETPAGTAAALLPALTAWGGQVPSVQFGGGLKPHGLGLGLLGALPQLGSLGMLGRLGQIHGLQNIHGINGPVAGGQAGGGLGDLLGLATSFLPGGGLLGGLLGGKAGGLFGGLKKIFHFAEGGIVPGHGFGDTVPAMLTPGERVLTRAQQGEARAAHVQINHYGDVHGVEGVQDLHAAFAWGVSQQLATAVAGN